MERIIKLLFIQISIIFFIGCKKNLESNTEDYDILQDKSAGSDDCNNQSIPIKKKKNSIDNNKDHISNPNNNERDFDNEKRNNQLQLYSKRPQIIESPQRNTHNPNINIEENHLTSQNKRITENNINNTENNLQLHNKTNNQYSLDQNNLNIENNQTNKTNNTTHNNTNKINCNNCGNITPIYNLYQGYCINCYMKYQKNNNQSNIENKESNHYQYNNNPSAPPINPEFSQSPPPYPNIRKTNTQQEVYSAPQHYRLLVNDNQVPQENNYQQNEPINPYYSNIDNFSYKLNTDVEGLKTTSEGDPQELKPKTSIFSVNENGTLNLNVPPNKKTMESDTDDDESNTEENELQYDSAKYKGKLGTGFLKKIKHGQNLKKFRTEVLDSNTNSYKSKYQKFREHYFEYDTNLELLEKDYLIYKKMKKEENANKKDNDKNDNSENSKGFMQTVKKKLISKSDKKKDKKDDPNDKKPTNTQTLVAV